MNKAAFNMWSLEHEDVLSGQLITERLEGVQVLVWLVFVKVHGGLIQALALGEERMTNYHKFSVEKDELWKSMGCRSVMSRRQSEPIMVTSSFPVV